LNNPSIWPWLTLIAIGLNGCAHQSAQVDLQPLDVRADLVADRPDPLTGRIEEVEPVLSPLALTEELLSLTTPPKSEQRIDIEATNRPAALFFAQLGRSQRLNIVVDPLVLGNITLSLRNVTLAQVIAALRDIYGYEFTRTSYGYRIAPNQVSTRIYRLNYLNIERTGNSKTTVGGDDSNTVSTSFSANLLGTEGNFWGGIKRSLLGFISSNQGNGDAVVINPQTGLLVVSASSTEHAAISRFLADAALILQKQVIIEAKIVEVTLDQEYRSGINWSLFNDRVGGANDSIGTGLAGDNLTGIGSAGGIFNLSLTLDNFSAMLQLLDHQGDVQVLSSPRVSTVNNQKAVIKVGTDEFFATVTNVASGTEGQVTPALELQQFFSGIALDVTPQISEDNSVTLHVRPTVTEVVGRTKVINLGSETYSLPLAYSNIRESDSIIRATNGQIIVIGGLLQQKQNLGSTGLPWLGKIPGLGWFFNQDRKSQQKSELVILLKPTVYDQYTSLNATDNVLERFE
jgi:MSHA biogenesis protein MshL|tara:strand:- start:792 stop:2336 length:1545 start_codon:yes stop_codon:yes gene_type:complete